MCQLDQGKTEYSYMHTICVYVGVIYLYKLTIDHGHYKCMINAKDCLQICTIDFLYT